MPLTATNASQSNHALGLSNTAKKWLLELIQQIHVPSTGEKIQSYLSAVMPSRFNPLATQQVDANDPDSLFNKQLDTLIATIFDPKVLGLNPEREGFYLDQLKKSLERRCQSLNEEKNAKKKSLLDKAQKLLFLINFHIKLFDMAPTLAEAAHPRRAINKALQAYYAAQVQLGSSINGFLPARLDLALREYEDQPTDVQAEIKNQQAFASPALTTGQIQQVISQRPIRRSPTPPAIPLTVITLPASNQPHLPENKYAGARRPSKPKQPYLPSPMDLGLENFSEEEKAAMLARYKKAALKYKIHLLSEVMDEFGNFYRKNKEHALFTKYAKSEVKTGKALTNALLKAYFPHNNKNHLDSHIEMDLATSMNRTAINMAFNNTPKALGLAWEKYKAVRALEEQTSVQAFHKLLDNKRGLLTEKRDNQLVDFAKCCGLFVLTILGLPFGLIGGAYFGYKYLFGDKSTDGHIFISDINKIRKNPNEDPQKSRCFNI